MHSSLYKKNIIILTFLIYYLSFHSFLYYSIDIIDLQRIDSLQSSVILFSYLSPVLHPNYTVSINWLVADFYRLSGYPRYEPLTLFVYLCPIGYH